MRISMNTQIAIVVMATVMGVVLADVCYTCVGTSATGGSCLGTVGSNAATTSCSGGCFKTYGKVGTLETYGRGCALTSCTEHNTDLLGILSQKYCCTGDKCNGANAPVAATFGALVVAVVTILLGRW